MTLDELIPILEVMRAKYGNLEVQHANNGGGIQRVEWDTYAGCPQGVITLYDELQR